jgi:hypothetical protein
LRISGWLPAQCGSCHMGRRLWMHSWSVACAWSVASQEAIGWGPQAQRGACLGAGQSVSRQLGMEARGRAALAAAGGRRGVVR